MIRKSSSQNPPGGGRQSPSERLVRNIRRATRKQYSAEEKIRIVLDDLRGESHDRRTLLARRHRRRPLRQLVEGVPRGRQARLDWRYGALRTSSASRHRGRD